MRKVIFLALVWVGCQSDQEIRLNGAAEDTFTVTRVVFDDGKPSAVTSYSTTRGEQARQAAGSKIAPSGGPLRQALISQDASCNGLDMWLFDQTNLQGNELCLAGLGEAYLGNFSRGSGNWAAAVQSFWAGQYPGYFTNPCRPQPCTPPTEWFSSYQRENTVSSFIQSAWYIDIVQPSPPP